MRCISFFSVGPDKQRDQLIEHVGIVTEGEPAFHRRQEAKRERHGATQTHLHKVSVSY